MNKLANPGPGQSPDIPHPEPNKIGPTIIYQSIVLFVGTSNL